MSPLRDLRRTDTQQIFDDARGRYEDVMGDTGMLVGRVNVLDF